MACLDEKFGTNDSMSHLIQQTSCSLHFQGQYDWNSVQRGEKGIPGLPGLRVSFFLVYIK